MDATLVENEVDQSDWSAAAIHALSYIQGSGAEAKMLGAKQETKKRSSKLKETDRSALLAITQAAVNVELFTIPLYMTSLYSIFGTHAITGDNSLYKGRLWPGMAPTSPRNKKDGKLTQNESAFNVIYSVFIEEMLHLQLAANICSSVGQNPVFTSPALQTENLGWKCYGEDLTVIPHIIDLKDTLDYNDVKVNIGSLNKEQIKLFLAIEQDEEQAKQGIKKDPKVLEKYFPEVPFKDWKVGMGESDLPLFGTIGYMYLAMWEYMNIEYDDNTTLWEYVYNPIKVQRDEFNKVTKGHPCMEYPGIFATMDGLSAAEALPEVLNMISGITEQGEGSEISAKLFELVGVSHEKGEVEKMYRPWKEGLEMDYKSYSDNGCPIHSADASARYDNSDIDHWERFKEIQDELNSKDCKIVTWDTWWSNPDNKWTAEMLINTEEAPLCPHARAHMEDFSDKIPTPEEVANALNSIRSDEKKYYKEFSYIANGAIAGITTVLDSYFSDYDVEFPFPSMAGSGDRMSICWAIFGKYPDLGLGIVPRQKDHDYHACQGLNPENIGGGDMPDVSIYHTCRGSNSCKNEGGCGFVQKVGTKGGGCGGSSCGTSSDIGGNAGCNPMIDGTLVSAPANNSCGAQGGCAVPISASQLFPKPGEFKTQGTMEVNDFLNGDKPLEQRHYYAEGDSVYDTAWDVYTTVLKANGYTEDGADGSKKLPEKPKADVIRIALPPST